MPILNDCVMNGFIMSSIMFLMATPLHNWPQSFDVWTVSQSRSVVTSMENPAQRTHLSQSENSANGHMAGLKIMPAWLKKNGGI